MARERGQFRNQLQILRKHKQKIKSLNWEGKGFLSFIRELWTGEATIEEDKENLLRRTKAVYVHVLYDHPEKGLLELYEARQIKPDGTILSQRNNNYLAEKSKPGETPLQTALRGLKEEIHLSLSEESRLTQTNEFIDYRRSAYPIDSAKNITEFNIYLREQEFVEGGYQESDSTKTTYFEWHPKS